ncbi:MAG: hypothetical protein MJA29_11640 [Candidatus Omnitrophica bacterium]|nr:hypothetical protein [Candidatus Omnitrophota bacterium]
MRDVHVGLTRKIDEDTLIETHWAVNDAALVPRADGTFVLHRVISLTFNGEPVVKNYRNSTYLVGDETWKWCGVFQRSRFTRRWKFSPLDYAEEEEKEPCQKK